MLDELLTVYAAVGTETRWVDCICQSFTNEILLKLSSDKHFCKDY